MADVMSTPPTSTNRDSALTAEQPVDLDELIAHFSRDFTGPDGVIDPEMGALLEAVRSVREERDRLREQVAAVEAEVEKFETTSAGVFTPGGVADALRRALSSPEATNG